MEKYSKTYVCYSIEGNPQAQRSLFFLNGMYRGKQSWMKQIRYSYFKDNIRMIFLDYRGAGNSHPAVTGKDYSERILDDIQFVMRQEKINKAGFIGYSIGGVFAFLFAVKHPAQVEELILLNSGFRISHAIKIIIQHSLSIIEAGIDFKMIYPFLYPWNYSEEYLEKIFLSIPGNMNIDSGYSNNKPAFREMLLTALSLSNYYPLIGKLSVPALLIGSNGDKVFPYQWQKEILEQNRFFQFKELGEATHSLFIERYEQVNSIIKDFMTRIQGAL